jgi:hypothetical protein
MGRSVNSLPCFPRALRALPGTKLHPVREARGWLFDPAKVAELKTARMAATPLRATPLSEGRLAARVFYLFDHGRELRKIVEEFEVPPHVVVRDLWHEWMIDLQDGEAVRRKSEQEDRRQRREQDELRELERRGEQDQKNFETMMAAMTAAAGGG